MDVLIDLVKELPPGASSDHRFTILSGVGDLLRRLGHRVYAAPSPRYNLRDQGWETYDEFTCGRINCLISRPPTGRGRWVSRFDYHRSRGAATLVYEEGWLPDAIFGYGAGALIDLSGGAQASDTRLDRRPAPGAPVPAAANRADGLPEQPFLLIPSHRFDRGHAGLARVARLLELVRAAVKATAGGPWSVVVGLPESDGQGVADECSALLKRGVTALATASARLQMTRIPSPTLLSVARFSAVVDPALIVMNLWAGTPVLCCASSPMASSGAALFERDMKRGLLRMMVGEYDQRGMRDAQARTLSWLQANSLCAVLPPEENLRRLELSAGFVF